MMPALRALGWRLRSQPMVLACIIAACAAGLVFYYQYQARAALQVQTRVILHQISEQTAVDVGAEIRRTLDGPVRETLRALTQRDMLAGRLDLVVQQYREGLTNYPQVQRFFVWSMETDEIAPGEALFIDREESTSAVLRVNGGSFYRDPVLGRKIIEIASSHTGSQSIYAAHEVNPGGDQLLLRLYYTDAQRDAYHAVLGFVVSPARFPDMFKALDARGLAGLLERRGPGTSLKLHVRDAHGDVIYGRSTPGPLVSNIVVPMAIYPATVSDDRLTSELPPTPWRIEISAADPDAGFVQAYWPTVASIALMIVAFGLTVQAHRRAAGLARLQADFVANASHQLQTPLSLLIAATETVELERAHPPEKLAQYLGIIRGEVTRLSALAQRILDCSSQHQRGSYEFELVHLDVLIRETVEAFAGSLSSRNFVFHIEQDGPGPQVMADPAAIEQVLANLLDNAVKYVGESREVRVRVRASGNEALIEVIDRGPGISHADCERIFDKFYRGAAASLHRNGFGLGLAIVQEVVRAHRGRVGVESTLGVGTTFRVVLPAVRPRRGDIEPVVKGSPSPELIT